METDQNKSEIVFEIKQLNFGYGSKNILNNFSFACRKGCVHGILGDNGAGKTTFFNLLYGTLRAKDASLDTIDRHQIAFLETDTHVYPYMTGMEYLELINGKKEDLVAQWNEIFELPLGEYVHNYSTGMKKKLLLFCVLLLNKKVIILDEPFNGMDLKTCEVIHYIIQRLKETSKTIILSSHILETIIKNSDEISYIEGGTVVKIYTKQEFTELERFVKDKFRTHVESKIDDLISGD